MLAPRPTIICVDCGGTAHLITTPREDGTWLEGDLVTYRCVDCRDRWDLVLDADDTSDVAHGSDTARGPADEADA